MRRFMLCVLLFFALDTYGLGANPLKNTYPFKYKSHSAISLGLGPSGYFGDLIPFSVYQSVGFKQLNFSGSLEYQRFIKKNVSVKAAISILRISGDENEYDSCSSYRSNYIRNLHFRNDIKEFGLMVQYDFRDRSSREFKNASIFPYIALGINLINHNPKALAPKKLQSDPNSWVALNDLSIPTEGIIYKKTTGSLPIELGAAFKLNPNFDFGFSLKYRFAFTDFLDDVSDTRSFNVINSTYSVRSNELIAPFSNRLRSNNLVTDFEPFNMAGNDIYYSIQLKVTYHFNRSIICYD